MGCFTFFFGKTARDLLRFPPFFPKGTPISPFQQAHASNVACLSFRTSTESSRHDDSAAAPTRSLLLASGGADHCVRMHDIALHH
jgi:hypothetical protein